MKVDYKKLKSAIKRAETEFKMSVYVVNIYADEIKIQGDVESYPDGFIYYHGSFYIFKDDGVDYIADKED